MSNVQELHGTNTTYTNGKVPILDERGDVITPRRGLMNKIDDKGKEAVTLSKSTLWFIGTGFILLQVIFNYGSSALSLARDDQSQKEQITSIQNNLATKTKTDDETAKEIRAQIDKLNAKFDTLQTALNNQAVKDAEQRGFRLGATTDPQGGK